MIYIRIRLYDDAVLLKSLQVNLPLEKQEELVELVGTENHSILIFLVAVHQHLYTLSVTLVCKKLVALNV